MEVIRIECPPCFDGSEGVLAIILRGPPNLGSTDFRTEPGEALQVGAMRHPKGWESPPHRHLLSPREVKGGTEVLVILSGTLRATFYDSRNHPVCSKNLIAGDTLVQFAGGHSFFALEEFHAVEVKQGPHREAHKVHFTPR